jgi:hypothetical protein
MIALPHRNVRRVRLKRMYADARSYRRDSERNESDVRTHVEEGVVLGEPRRNQLNNPWLIATSEESLGLDTISEIQVERCSPDHSLACTPAARALEAAYQSSRQRMLTHARRKRAHHICARAYHPRDGRSACPGTRWVHRPREHE